MRKIAATAAISAICLLWLPSFARAQFEGTIPAVGDPPEAEPNAEYLALNSAVSFLDSAMPRTTIRARYDIDSGARQPVRADYLFSSRDFGVPEPYVNQTEADLYLEYAPSSFFSVFLDQPYRWVNPTRNASRDGNADSGFGCKLAVWDDAAFLGTIQVRGTAPSSTNGVDDHHWAIEPTFLFDSNLASIFTVEGQFGAQLPLSNAPFSGDVGKYGLGLSLATRNDSGFWVTPVIEALGWTCIGGATEIVDPSGVEVRGAGGSTIVSGAAGVRFGIGRELEIYGGYDRSLTGSAWFREQIRVELRLLF
jgi:hypothetical protein